MTDLGIEARGISRDFGAFRALEVRGGDRAFPGHGRPKPENEELVALRRENARLREERDFLKKAAAYFAKVDRRGSR